MAYEPPNGIDGIITIIGLFFFILLLISLFIDPSKQAKDDEDGKRDNR